MWRSRVPKPFGGLRRGGDEPLEGRNLARLPSQAGVHLKPQIVRSPPPRARRGSVKTFVYFHLREDAPPTEY